MFFPGGPCGGIRPIIPIAPWMPEMEAKHKANINNNVLKVTMGFKRVHSYTLIKS